MANVIITLKAMMDSPDVDAHAAEKKIVAKVKDFNNHKDVRASVHPVAFGLKAVEVMFVSDEAQGSTDKLEEEIIAIDGVGSVEVTDVRRAIG